MPTANEKKSHAHSHFMFAPPAADINRRVILEKMLKFAEEHKGESGDNAHAIKLDAKNRRFHIYCFLNGNDVYDSKYKGVQTFGSIPNELYTVDKNDSKFKPVHDAKPTEIIRALRFLDGKLLSFSLTISNGKHYLKLSIGTDKAIRIFQEDSGKNELSISELESLKTTDAIFIASLIKPLESLLDNKQSPSAEKSCQASR